VTAPARLIAALVVHEAALDAFERTRAGREAAAEKARKLLETEARTRRRSRLRYWIIGLSLTLSAWAGTSLVAIERSGSGASQDAGEGGPAALMILAIVGGGVAYAWLTVIYEPLNSGFRIATFIGRSCYYTLVFWLVAMIGFGIGFGFGYATGS
jgi:hypothetical protein